MNVLIFDNLKTTAFINRMIENIQNTFLQLSQTELFILILFAAVFFFRMLFLFLFTGRVIFHKKKVEPENKEATLSLILTVRNEEQSLKDHLRKVFDLKNAEFEVVVVDNFSDDNSHWVLNMMKKEHDNLKVSSLNQETNHSVKIAQNIALKAAKNDWIIVVPASVTGFQENWLQRIIASLDENIQVVVNYSNVVKGSGFFKQLYRTENFFQQLTSSGFILCGLPFVYTEENIAFRKGDYFKTGGYGQKIREFYANLELLINTFIKRKTTMVIFNNQTAIFKDIPIEKNDYFDLINKQIRIERYLSFWRKIMLRVNGFVHLIFIPFLMFLFFFIPGIWIVFTVVSILFLAAFSFIIKTALKRLNERNLFLSSLLYGILVPYFKLFYYWYFKVYSRRQKWRSKN